jgi:hypothetical protein
MGFIRDKSEELTGYQHYGDYRETIDFQNDFVMVYGSGEAVYPRIRAFAEKGYVVHLMTGISWGEYRDYLYGEFDGRKHLDEAQTDRDGDVIGHGPDVPYMVPAVSFADYITEKLKPAVDAGVAAIHLEEPEFWDRAGYSVAFKREYLLHYKSDYVPPYKSLDAAYRAARLKYYLYRRTIDRVFTALKEYAAVRYNRLIRFYVPTHSLINYSQWKIVSPEGSLIDLPCVDGFIAQVWTGTSRSPNMYMGVKKERTFETAYLEYGVMQALVEHSGRRMWFLHDPIEDLPAYGWEDYKYNYLKTVTASLLHPKVSRYEICPWPQRVFEGKYPKDPATGKETENARPIPPEYATLLSNIFNTLGDMAQEENVFDGFPYGAGVFIADSAMFQRTYPDGFCAPEEGLSTPEGRNAFASGGLFPEFFGLALPLLKDGLPLRPLLLDNLRRNPSYLDGYGLAVLSYEFIKPEGPDINAALAAWVRGGGTLVYVGNSEDPFHSVPAWWNQTGGKSYNDPAEHLFELLGVRPENGNIYGIGKGFFAYLKKRPLEFCADPESARAYRDFTRTAAAAAGMRWDYANRLVLRRGKYIVCTVMDETVHGEGAVFRGLFCDMYSPAFDILTEKTVNPDENALLLDFSKIADRETAVIGTTCRIESLEKDGNRVRIYTKGADSIDAYLRLRLPGKPARVEADIEVGHQWDGRSRTALLSYKSGVKGAHIEILWEEPHVLLL